MIERVQRALAPTIAGLEGPTRRVGTTLGAAIAGVGALLLGVLGLAVAAFVILGVIGLLLIGLRAL
jgi:hypothetical protein